MCRGAGDRHLTAAAFATEPLRVGDLAGRGHRGKVLPHGATDAVGDGPGRDGVTRPSVSPGRGPLFVDELDRPLVGKQGVDDAIPARRVSHADPEENVAGREPVAELARERPRRLRRVQDPLSDARRAGEDRVPGSRSRVDPDDEVPFRCTNLEGVFDRGPERTSVPVLGDNEDVRVRNLPGFVG
jgi:hypothetical protein